MKVACVIPARYDSQRFPGKVLAKLAGRPLIQWVYIQACQAKKVDRVIVATDDKRVEECVRDFGGMAVITSPDHKSGTDRVAEVAQGLSCSLIVNVQGDEPLVPPEAIDQAVELLIDQPAAKMATLATPIIEDQDLINPHLVKVVIDGKGNALYFSRAPIPFPRSQLTQDGMRGDGPGPLPAGPFYRHVGLYVYRRSFLLRLASLPVAAIEEVEKLEQLRALAAGFRIRVAVTSYSGIGVDTPEDLCRLEKILSDQVDR